MSILGPVILVVVKVVPFFFVLLTLVAYITLMERKLLGFIQVRLGPNRVGPWGLLQPLADGAKLLFKEEITVEKASRFIYLLSPVIATITALVPFAVIPFGKGLPIDRIFGLPVSSFALNKGIIADINIGVLYIFAITSLGVYGVVLAGWSSNSKYSLLGGIRASAQMISYELALGLSIIGVLMLAGTLSLVGIVEAQDKIYNWFIVRQPLAFILFLIAGSAEICRTPFDLVECENELVAGYQTEYSSMKFGLFYLGEYAHLLLLSTMVTTLFLGGWQGPILMPWMWFSIKTFVMLFFFIWIRGTYPRIRYDRLMKFGWKVLLPATLVNIVITAFLYYLWIEWKGL